MVFQEKIATRTKQAAGKPGDQPEKAKHELQYCQITSQASRVKLLTIQRIMILTGENEARSFAGHIDRLLRISTLTDTEDTCRVIQGFT